MRMDDEDEFMEKYDNDLNGLTSLDDMRRAIRKNTNWRIFQQILLVISIVISIISILLALRLII